MTNERRSDRPADGPAPHPEVAELDEAGAKAQGEGGENSAQTVSTSPNLVVEGLSSDSVPPSSAATGRREEPVDRESELVRPSQRVAAEEASRRPVVTEERAWQTSTGRISGQAQLESSRGGAGEPPSGGREGRGGELPKRGFPWRKLFVWSASLTVALAIAGAIAVVLVVQHFGKDLPDVENLESNYKPPQVTRVLARDGTLLANIFTERRTVVRFKTLPPHVLQAFLAAEDAGFFEHEGLDYLGMLRAMWANLRAGHVRQGGSTITQQVVKNVLLDSERSYRRKIRETLLAHRLEKTLSKEQILGLYVNHIYLGHGRWGVEEAASYYFGKHASELDIAEAALLAGIVAAPERYSPRRDEDKALERRRYVLGQMRDKGFMTPAVFDAVVDAPLRLAPAVEAESDLAPELVAYVKKVLARVAGDDARRGGFTVQTTLDPHLQTAARKALRDGLDGYMKRQKLAPPFTLEKRRLWGEIFEGKPRRYGIYTGRVVGRDDDKGTIDVQVGEVLGRVFLRKEERYNPERLSPTQFVGENAALRVAVLDEPEGAEPVRLGLELAPQGALVAIDVRTREVRAAVGSYEALVGGLDRTVQARRQPGSSFKPFLYSYALHSRRVTAATVFEFEKATKATQGDDAEGTEEESSIERLSLRAGVAKSDNRVAEDVIERVGAGNVVDWAHALGIEAKLGATKSLALGAYEVTPLEITNAYATFASGGELAAPVFITGVTGPDGPVELPVPPPARRVMPREVAYLTTSLLSSVVQDGTAKRARSLGRPVAGKTGTTNKAKDAWFVGYSTEFVAGTWVGYDDAIPLGWGEAGAVTALPIWIDFMKAAHEGKPATEFPRPPGLIEQKIDPTTGLLARFDQEDAVEELFLEGTVPTEVAGEESSDPAELEEAEAEEGEDEGSEPEGGFLQAAVPPSPTSLSGNGPTSPSPKPAPPTPPPPVHAEEAPPPLPEPPPF